VLKKIGEVLTNFSALFFPDGDRLSERQAEDHFRLVEQARREWQDAKLRFDQICDPDLIDYAIYAIEAAERRYIYLIKQAREGGLATNQGLPLAVEGAEKRP
jgi:hypothetical protein